MTRFIGYVTGIYPYSRKHSLSSRKFGRGSITREELREIQMNDAQEFVDKQKDMGLDFISDGQFLWMDYARPFAVSMEDVKEEHLEMMRRSDTNTFIRKPNISIPDYLMNTKLGDFMLPLQIDNRSVKLYGPYTFANISVSDSPIEDIMYAYAHAASHQIQDLVSSHNIKLVEIVEYMISEKRPDRDMMNTIRSCIAGMTNRIDAETNLSAPFHSMQPIWKDLMEFPVKGLTVDMRARDYLNAVPDAKELVNNHSFLFDYDFKKTLILGCVNGRNGGLTPGKGLETPEWIADVMAKVNSKLNLDVIGATFSTDEVIVPRSIADKKLESIAKARSLAGGMS